ncbi:hypothetical protein GO730_08810 [Spirosoma sp. HMF3257]|nr:hypothetical protein [Spirosoma telluris]
MNPVISPGDRVSVEVRTNGYYRAYKKVWYFAGRLRGVSQLSSMGRGK